MSNYSDEKNGYKHNKIVFGYHNPHAIFRDGYLAAEKDLAFTELEQSVFRTLLEPENCGSFLWSEARIEARVSLIQKVLGEKEVEDE